MYTTMHEQLGHIFFIFKSIMSVPTYHISIMLECTSYTCTSAVIMHLCFVIKIFQHYYLASNFLSSSQQTKVYSDFPCVLGKHSEILP